MNVLFMFAVPFGLLYGKNRTVINKRTVNTGKLEIRYWLPLILF